MPIINRIADYFDEMQGWRHHIHANPELGFDCFQTAKFVRSKLEEFGHFRPTVKISMDDIKSRPVIDTPQPTPVKEVDDIPAGETVLIKPAQPTE